MLVYSTQQEINYDWGFTTKQILTRGALVGEHLICHPLHISIILDE